VAARAGALTVQVNPNATDIDSLVTVAYRGAAGAVLPELVRATWT
jgi:NAD-dependent SIR2 family protein deacetylase